MFSVVFNCASQTGKVKKFLAAEPWDMMDWMTKIQQVGQAAQTPEG